MLESSKLSVNSVVKNYFTTAADGKPPGIPDHIRRRTFIVKSSYFAHEVPLAGLT